MYDKTHYNNCKVISLQLIKKNVGDAVTKVGIILETLEFDMKEQRYKK